MILAQFKIFESDVDKFFCLAVGKFQPLLNPNFLIFLNAAAIGKLLIGIWSHLRLK